MTNPYTTFSKNDLELSPLGIKKTGKSSVTNDRVVHSSALSRLFEILD
jgi:hypothetical protein